MSREDFIHDHYSGRITSGVEGFKIHDWESRQCQFLRYQVLIDTLELEGCSLLDVGCGVGDLLGFIREKGLDCRYTGIDLLEKMVTEARRRYPDKDEFIQGNIFREQLFSPESFDIVFCSGVFNLNLGNNWEFLQHAVHIFLQNSSSFVVFNLLNDCSPTKEDSYFYYNPRKVKEFIRSITPKVKIIEGYLPNDFTVCIHK